VRSNDKLSGLLPVLIDPGPTGAWHVRPPADQDFATAFAVDLFEFAWTVYNDLNLVHPANLDHPHSRGWLSIFRNWWRVDVVSAAWNRYRGSYSREFQLFVTTNILTLE
jgi:hypothetical protein